MGPGRRNLSRLEFVLGIDDLKEITFNPRINNLLILDDLMEELFADKKASALLTKDMHHKNVTVIFVVQNLFKQGKSMRDIALPGNSPFQIPARCSANSHPVAPNRHQRPGKSIP